MSKKIVAKQVIPGMENPEVRTFAEWQSYRRRYPNFYQLSAVQSELVLDAKALGADRFFDLPSRDEWVAA